MGNFWGMSGWFGALVWAPRALDGELTPPRCGWAGMMKTNLAGVGICGCMTSLSLFEIMIKNGSFWRFFLLFWGCGGGPKGPGWAKYPFQMWMRYYDEVICGWCGYLWLHDITFTIWNHDENGSFCRVFPAVLGLWWGPRGPWMGKIPLPDVDDILWWSNMWLVWVFVVAWYHFNHLKTW